MSRLVGTNCVETTPKLAFWLISSVGSTKFTWLKMLKKSVEKPIETRSVSAVFLPNDISRFQNGSPRSGFERPVGPALLLCTVRDLSGPAATLADSCMAWDFMALAELGVSCVGH